MGAIRIAVPQIPLFLATIILLRKLIGGGNAISGSQWWDRDDM